MRIHLLSDLHLEFGKWPRSVDINAIDADVTVLAGDIGVGLQGLEWAMTIERPVVYVMGNHEFYGQRPMETLWRKARDKVADTQITLLENESIILDDPRQPGERVRFLGTTLWTDFAVHGADQQEAGMRHAARTMSDYQAIYVSRRGGVAVEPGFEPKHSGDRLTPRKVLSLHHDSRDFLEQELRRVPAPLSVVLADTWTKTVVVTHHAPSARSALYGQATKSDVAYVSNLETLVSQVDLWLHGHTHVQADYRIEGMSAGRVVMNPRGYVGNGLVQGFDPLMIVEV